MIVINATTKFLPSGTTGIRSKVVWGNKRIADDDEFTDHQQMLISNTWLRTQKITDIELTYVG